MNEKNNSKNYGRSSIFNYIKNRLLEKHVIQDEILTKSKFLKAGRYKTIRISKTIIYKDDTAKGFIKSIAKDLPITFPRVKFYIKQLIATFFTIKINNDGINKIQGEFALLTQNGNIKIFDNENQKVYHFIKESKEYKEIKRAYNEFRPFFNLTIIDFDINEQLVIERLIGLNETSYKNPKFVNQIFSKILIDYEIYLLNCINNQSTELLTYYERWGTLNETETLLIDLEELYNIDLNNLKWPYVYCHGDLWRGNVLNCEGNYYLIDWEWSNNHVFFYDLFTFMILQAIFQKDYTLIDSYLEGEFDKELKMIFSSMNIKYCTEKRLLYLLYSIVEHITTRGKQEKYLVLLLNLKERYDISLDIKNYPSFNQ